jgi:hypothetical protein
MIEKIVKHTREWAKRTFILFLLLIVFSACKKKEGYGGKSTIYGKVQERKYDDFGQFENEYYVPEQKVYIVFGDNEFYNDEIRTDYTGKFQFSYLYAGSYTVYAYSECGPLNPCASGEKAILLTVEVLKNGDTVVTDDIQIENW